MFSSEAGNRLTARALFLAEDQNVSKRQRREIFMKKLILLLLAFVLLACCGCQPITDAAEETSSSAESMDTTETTSSLTEQSSETTETTLGFEDFTFAKPVIYLYPEEKTEVSVRIEWEGALDCTYPLYQDGWHVLASPDGTLENLSDGRTYSYLFWDGHMDADFDMSRGFVIKGEDTASFLQNILYRMGLTESEANDFIVYWLPHMQKNPYNLITFQNEAYTELVHLEITPQPESVLRVFMVFQALNAPIEIESPEIVYFERNGFTAVEWGGGEAPASQ